MIYNTFKDLKISALGMGTMRLPLINGDNSKIDVEAATELIAYAMSHGVNYYDTAWVYHSKTSERVMGEILKSYPRDSFYLATKFPGFNLDNMDKVEEIFEDQIKKCQVDYFDFYLFHNLCEANVDAYLDPKYGIFDYLMKQKQNGRIRHLGFSTHGSLTTIERFLDAYGEHMEFAQIQLNWLDWDFQNAKAKLALLRERNIPVIIMEPVRGGKLAKLEKEYESKLKALRPDESIPAWAFRFLQSIDGIFVTLSGMSNLEQLKDNLATYEYAKPLSDKEKDTLLAIAAEMTAKTALPCTKCQYCAPHCPMSLDIPRIIELYNEHVYSGGGFIAPMTLSGWENEKKPSACLGCRECEALCPQGIKISEMMSDFVKRLK
ncbi:MAG: aldo/keto reductase [Clostridia bacterium]|nr:aldo/keto reductase [Clostridia bacterium]